MASESIVPHVVPEVGGLEWPRFCYAGPSAFEEDLAASTKKRARVVTPPLAQPRQKVTAPKKRKASSDLRSSPETSAFERPSKVARQSGSSNIIQQQQQTLSHLFNPFPGMAALTRPLLSFTAHPPPPPPPPSEFAYSDLMKRMAAKYQQPEERPATPPPPPPPQPSFANPFGLPPYFAHFLPTATAAAAASSLHSAANSDAESVADSNCGSTSAGSPVGRSAGSAALDLSPKSVVVDSFEDWSVDQVVAFVRGVEGCEEYAEIFREHTLEGSSLALLSESHLTGILGLKLGPAMRLLKAIRAL